MFLFFIFKILEWKFDKSKQEQIRLDQATLYKKYPSYKKKRTRKNSFKQNTEDNFLKKKIDIEQIEENPLEEKSICYICMQNINDPVSIKTSIYAYCRNCIMDWIKEKNVCPQTEIPLSNPEITKIFI